MKKSDTPQIMEVNTNKGFKNKYASTDMNIKTNSIQILNKDALFNYKLELSKLRLKTLKEDPFYRIYNSWGFLALMLTGVSLWMLDVQLHLRFFGYAGFPLILLALVIMFYAPWRCDKISEQALKNVFKTEETTK